MKRKSSLRILLIIVTIAASASSYVFMNQDIRNTALINSLNQNTAASVEEEKADVAPASHLADLKLFRKLLDVGKRFIPAT